MGGDIKQEPASGAAPYGVYGVQSAGMVSPPRVGSSSHGRTMSHPGDFVRVSLQRPHLGVTNTYFAFSPNAVPADLAGPRRRRKHVGPIVVPTTTIPVWHDCRRGQVGRAGPYASPPAWLELELVPQPPPVFLFGKFTALLSIACGHCVTRETCGAKKTTHDVKRAKAPRLKSDVGRVASIVSPCLFLASRKRQMAVLAPHLTFILFLMLTQSQGAIGLPIRPVCAVPYRPTRTRAFNSQRGLPRAVRVDRLSCRPASAQPASFGRRKLERWRRRSIVFWRICSWRASRQRRGICPAHRRRGYYLGPAGRELGGVSRRSALTTPAASSPARPAADHLCSVGRCIDVSSSVCRYGCSIHQPLTHKPEPDCFSPRSLA